MEVAFAFICDYADGSSGKLNALGIGFDEIRVPRVPAEHRQMTVVAEFSIDPADPKDLKLNVTVTSPTGATVADVGAEITLPDMPLAERTPHARLVASLGDTPLPEAGEYSVALSVHGRIIWQRRFNVIALESGPVPKTLPTGRRRKQARP